MIRSLIEGARTGKLSSQQLVAVAKNDFKVDIDVQRIQQIISNALFIKYPKNLKTPRMSDDKKMIA